MIENKLEISEDTLKNASECQKKSSCLFGEQKDLCKIEKHITNNLIYVKCLNKEYCNFQISFGSFYVCSCPVRKEIYNRYGI